MNEICKQCGTEGTEGGKFCPSCGASIEATASKADPLLGRTVGGSYSLQELVGVGGMGRVYRAEQNILGRTVAVKVIHPHLLGDEQTVARFYTEARAASRLNHPNSVGIIDFGRTDDGILYLAMEYLQGKDLAVILYEEGPLPFPRICDILIATLGALGEAHHLGVIHRDLKPENIILKRLRTGADLVKVVDFGLATIVSGAASTNITAPGLVCGTPDYMSPEQGRGDPVDGRGDLYALGVVLFEMLTDQLPFEDETPTKVVMRHINDPVPDPSAIAPHRQIPRSLVEICTKALSKKAADRFQTAEEMQAELRSVLDELRDDRRHDEIICPTCGARSAATTRFCGTCGARFTGSFSLPVGAAGVSPSRPSFYPEHVPKRALVGRADEMSEISGMLHEAKTATVWLHLTGEPGVGKTRLLTELVKQAEEAGDVVVGAGPHPTRAPVPYEALKTLVAGLLNVDAEGLRKLATREGAFAEPLVRAGLAELADPVGLAGFEGRGRTGAVASALATAIKAGASRSKSGRIVIVIDDLHACDGLSQGVVARFVAGGNDSPTLVATSSIGSHAGQGAHRVIQLHGLDLAASAGFMSGRAQESPPGGAPRGRYMLPLYLEQIKALGADSDNDETLPPRLADAVAQRVEQLDVEARRVLQAMAVSGDSCSMEWLTRLTAPDDPGAGLLLLEREGLITVGGGQVRINHPFVRDLVEASIPAQARCTMHERAYQLATEKGAPLEVCAEHAFRAGEPMSALMLLERMGDTAMRRGDATAAVLAYRRALELARAEMLETGDTLLEAGILTFSRKLGEALERAGDIVGGDGVLREALDLADPNSSERARMLVVLGLVASRRERRRDALRLLGQGLEIVTRQRNPEVESRIQLTMARVRREDGDNLGAANAFQRAVVLEKQTGAAAVQRARTHLELGEVLVDVGDTDEARRSLAEAILLARESGAPAVQAMATGIMASVDEVAGLNGRAAEQYRDAARLAAEAGDATSHERWRKAADVLGH